MMSPGFPGIGLGGIQKSSPSGAGKTSVCKRILKNDDKIQISISATTRQSRQNEVNGVDYNFISRDEFLQKIKNNKFNF